MVEAFTGAYHLGRLYVEPHDGDHAVMERSQHHETVASVYATGEGIERLDQPLVVKLDDMHLPVFASEAVPAGTLAVPGAVLEASRIDQPPTLTEILVAKADQAARLLEWFTPYTVAEPSVA